MRLKEQISMPKVSAKRLDLISRNRGIYKLTRLEIILEKKLLFILHLFNSSHTISLILVPSGSSYKSLSPLKQMSTHSSISTLSLQQR